MRLPQAIRPPRALFPEPKEPIWKENPMPSRTGPSRAPDHRTVERIVSAVVMPIGPAAIAATSLIFLLAYGNSEPSIGDLAANPGPARWSNFVGTLGLFAAVPGAYAAIHLGRRYGPTLAAWTAAFLIPGYLGAAGLMAADVTTLAGIEAGFDEGALTRLDNATWSVVLAPALIFVVGHIVGNVLLALLAFRHRLVPRPVALGLLVSQPLHFAAFMIFGSLALDVVAWSLTTLGMAFLSLRVLRTPNNEWQLPAFRSETFAVGLAIPERSAI
jgi:hypothetical protein